MKVLRPTAIVDAMLISSSVPETDYDTWSSGATYVIGDRVIKGHLIWESLQGSNINRDPETDISNPPFWLQVASTNRWRMFDGTVNSTTAAAGQITVDMRPGVVNAVGLVELVGTSVTVQMLDGTSEVYRRTLALDATPIDDWFDYFFEPSQTAGAVIFDGLPAYLTAIVRVTIDGASTVECGGCVFGTLYDIGATLSSPSAGIVDYSRKSTNEFGVTSIVRRAFAKRSTARVWFWNDQLHRIFSLLADLRSTLCLWVGADDTLTYSPLVVYGWYRDFQVDVSYADLSYCSLEIEGVI